MKHIIKILSLFVAIILIAFTFTSCKSEPTELNFYDMTEEDLFKLNNKQVVLYGYYTLNQPLNRIGYISSQPYRGYTVEQVENSDELSFYQIIFEEDETIAVSFKTMPDYTTTPVKVTGILDAGPFTDNNSFIYNFRIKEAIVEEIDIQLFEPEVQTFYNLAELGFVDVVYTKLMDLEMFLNDERKYKSFPSFEEYSEINKYFSTIKSNYVEKDFIDLINRVNSVYEKYSKIYETEKYKDEDLEKDIDKLYEAFDSFISSYSHLSENSNSDADINDVSDISTTAQN